MKRVCFILFLLLVISAGAQSPPAEYISADQGLSQGFVTCMIQDREGFIWAGTPQGLNRYDGHTVKVFTNDVFDSLTLSNNYISSLLDLGEYLFIGTWGGGINLFHKRTQRFFRVPSHMTEREGSQTDVEQVSNTYPSIWVGQGILSDEQGNIWSRAHNSDNWNEGWAVQMEFPDGFWEQLPDHPDLIFQIKFHTWWMNRWLQLTDLPKYLSHDGDMLYCYQSDGLLSFDYSRNQWLPVRKFKNAPDIISNVVTSENTVGTLLQDSDLNTYYCHDDVNCKYLGRLRGYVYQLDSALIWIHEGQFFKAIDWSLTNDSLLNSNPIIQVPMTYGRTIYMFDRSDNLWVADGVIGLSKYILGQQRFDHFFKGHSLMNAPFKAENGSFSYIKWNKENLQFEGPPDSGLAEIKRLLISNSSNGFKINKDIRGHYWLVAHNEHTKCPYIIKVNPRNGESETIPIPDLKRWALYSMIDEKGIMWFAIEGTLVAFDTKRDFQDTVLKFYKFSDDQTGQPDVNFIEKTADNTIWMATSQGLIRATPQKDSDLFDFIRYKTDPQNKHSLRSNNISALLADPHDTNILWIGTKGGGLHQMNIKTEHFRSFTTKEGFPDNVIYGILSDYFINTESKDYALWMSTNRGLVQYIPSTEKLKNYTKADGLQSDEFNTHSFAYTDDLQKKGRLMFGGINGLNVFKPAEIRDNPFKPNVVLTNLLINNKSVSVRSDSDILTESIEYTSKINLPYEKNNVTFQFAALEYTSPSKNKYRYYLKGAEKEWAHEGLVPSANYLNLPSGRYDFMVDGSNNDGLWSDHPATIHITIMPPWYRTWWAYMGYLLILGGVTYFICSSIIKERKFRARLKERKRKAEQLQREMNHLKEMNELRLADFTERLVEKSDLIKSLEKEIDKKELDISNGETIKKLRSLNILTSEDWDEYLDLFEQIHPGYHGSLKNTLPSMTNAELRWAILNKMNLSQNKMASVLGISTDAVKKTRQRLQKKLNLPDDQAIEEFFSRL